MLTLFTVSTFEGWPKYVLHDYCTDSVLAMLNTYPICSVMLFADTFLEVGRASATLRLEHNH